MRRMRNAADTSAPPSSQSTGDESSNTDPPLTTPEVPSSPRIAGAGRGGGRGRGGAGHRAAPGVPGAGAGAPPPRPGPPPSAASAGGRLTFAQLVPAVEGICQQLKGNRPVGQAHGRISQLSRRAGKGTFAVALVDVDGQVWQFGNTEDYFTLQDAIYPFIYAFLAEEKGMTSINTLVGDKRSDLPPTAMSLNTDKKPHNAMTAAGGMVLSSSLYDSAKSPAERIRTVLKKMKTITGTRFTCDMPTYISTNTSSDDHYALAYWLKGTVASMRTVDPPKLLDFFFQLRCIESTVVEFAKLGAVLANGGNLPNGGGSAVKKEAVDETIKLMSVCGLKQMSCEG